LAGGFKCTFCDEFETIHHLFFTRSTAKYMWSVVSKTFGANISVGWRLFLGKKNKCTCGWGGSFVLGFM
jgi:hypothetical protein